MIKNNKLINTLVVGAGMILAASLAWAGNSLWRFTPLTPAAITLTSGETAAVLYRITNQSRQAHALKMKNIPGITQVTTVGNCSDPFVLGHNQSCILNLAVTGNTLSKTVTDGPVLCDHDNPNQCYQPEPVNRLKIIKNEAVSYTVGGSVYGLHGTLELTNGSDILSLTADGSFVFSNSLAIGTTYSVAVQQNPPHQTCTVSKGYGVIANEDITNVVINCSTNTHTVSGNVSGLADSESLVLQTHDGKTLTLTKNGSFTVPNAVAQGALYRITVLTQPVTQICTVSNGGGIVSSADITNVEVICSAKALTLGGTVANLSGELVVQNNGGGDLRVTSNGPFAFPFAIADKANYQVTVLTQPEGQTCTVHNGSNIVNNADVTDVEIICINNTTLIPSLRDLALSVTGLTEYGVPGIPLSGASRNIKITNTGNAEASNLAVTFPAWPSGTTSSTTCSNTLEVGESCSITVTPGTTPTSDGTNPCSNYGTAPIPDVIQVKAENGNSVAINVVVLSYGCIYQGGYIYSLDDAVETTRSVGGKVVSSTDQAAPYPNGVGWSATGNTEANTTIDHYDIPGIYESSTDPCQGNSDGACNSKQILAHYNSIINSSPSYYAASLCQGTINQYSDWYLPAICELGYDIERIGSGCGSFYSPRLQNIQSNLVDRLDLLTGYYWSSTEVSVAAQSVAWAEHFASAEQTLQRYVQKNDLLGVRCSRALT